MTSRKKYSPCFFSLSLFFVLPFISCRQIDVYEKNTVIPKYQWQSDLSVTGSFTIRDTSSAYNVYLVIRHTDAYRYNNIWLDVGLQLPGDTMYHQKVDLQLGNDAGGWEGTGMNDIWEVRKLLNAEPWRFKRPGTCSFSIAQVMREDPLNHIMSAGLRVEKAKY